MKRILLFSTLFFGAVHLGFAAELGKPDGSPVRLGDSVDMVKQALGTDMNPELDEETGILPATLLRPRTSSIQLKTKGIRVFFNADKKAKTIRFDVPFKGRIAGIRIGETKEKLVEILGEPVKKIKFGTKENNYIYYPDDVTTLNFLFSAENTVETIFVAK